MIQRSHTLGQVAAAHPAATQVFLRHRLDFCCGGGQVLEQACAKAGLDPDQILAEIQQEPEPLLLANWERSPLPELADFIVSRYHDPLRRDLPGLLEAAKRVERVHGAKPSCPHGLAQHLEHMSTEIRLHLEKEERVLFPAIRSALEPESILLPVRVLMQEHEDHGENLRRLRELCSDYVPPPEACATWRALFASLEQLEADLMEHIHLENNLLFPRALKVFTSALPQA